MIPPAIVEDRVADARLAKEAGIRRDLRAMGLAYPPRGVYLRGLKRERELEVWVEGASGRYRLFRTYPVRAMSGDLGPKRREGDRQAPEGFYVVNRFNPRSRFLLSLGLDYPNRRDRARGEARPGGDIFIHGKEASIGCLAMGDEAIQEIYLLALDARRKPVAVHVFPGRMHDAGWRELSRTAPAELVRYWSELRPGYLQFERTRRVPEVRVVDGRYVLR